MPCVCHVIPECFCSWHKPLNFWPSGIVIPRNASKAMCSLLQLVPRKCLSEQTAEISFIVEICYNSQALISHYRDCKALQEIIYSSTAILVQLFKKFPSMVFQQTHCKVTVQSHCSKCDTSKLIRHLCKIWQSYSINCFSHDVPVTDNSTRERWA